MTPDQISSGEPGVQALFSESCVSQRVIQIQVLFSQSDSDLDFRVRMQKASDVLRHVWPTSCDFLFQALYQKITSSGDTIRHSRDIYYLERLNCTELVHVGLPASCTIKEQNLQLCSCVRHL